MLVAIAAFGTSCKKSAEGVSGADTNQTFSTLKVNNNFNWSTTKQITFVVEGLKTINPINGTLSVIDAKSGVQFYKGSHLIGDNVSLKLNIPAATDSLQIQFGTIQKNYSAKANTVLANYLPTLTD